MSSKSDWSRAFKWLGPKMHWPAQPEIVEGMLMEFSQFELGMHTLPPMEDEEKTTYRQMVCDHAPLS